MGNVGAQVTGLEGGMGFVLWMGEGQAAKLEGYSYGEDTTQLDFARIGFAAVGDRIR